MVQVGTGAVIVQMKGADEAAVSPRVGVAARERPVLLRAGESVDTGMVVGAARAGAVWRARRVRQDAEVVVEGMVLLHHDDDVIHALQTVVRARR